MVEIPAWMMWSARVALVPTLLAVGWYTYYAIVRRGELRLHAMTWIMEWLYPLGMTLKIGMLGPWWLRWYLPDVGFPVTIAFVLMVVVRRFLPASDTSLLDRLRKDRVRFTAQIAAVGVGVLVSIIYEIIAHFAVEAAERQDPAFKSLVGKFDPVDVACYVGGGLAAIAIFVYWRRVIDGKIAVVTQYEEPAPEVAESRPQANTEPRRRPGRRGTGPHGRVRSHRKRPHQ